MKVPVHFLHFLVMLGAVLPAPLFGQFGCTDPFADNYDAGATADDGSCSYCPINEQTVLMEMTDAFGNGWNGATYTIVSTGSITSYQQGALEFAQHGDGLTYGYDHLCLAEGCHEISVNGPEGTLAGIGFTLTNSNGGMIFTGQGMFGPMWYPVNGSSFCDISACLNPGCINYNPWAIWDDGSCVCTEVAADVNGSGFVDTDDLLAVIGGYGSDQCPWPCVLDLDQDGYIGVPDVLAVLGNFGVTGD